MVISKILKRVWNEFVYGGHLLSLGASGIIYTIMLILNLNVNLALLAIMYLMPQIIYVYDHLKGAEEDAKTNPSRSKYFQEQKNKINCLLVFYGTALLGFLIYLKSWQIVLAIFLITIFSIMYTIAFKNLTKKIPAFKNIFVAFIWAFSPIILVSLYYGLGWNIALLLLFLFIFLRWVVNTSFFDIKDLESDRDSLIKTLPVVLGKDKAINFLQVINILSLVPIIVGVGLGLLPSFSLGVLLFYFYAFYYLEMAKKSQAKISFLSYVVADGEYILWPIIILLVKH